MQRQRVSSKGQIDAGRVRRSNNEVGVSLDSGYLPYICTLSPSTSTIRRQVHVQLRSNKWCPLHSSVNPCESTAKEPSHTARIRHLIDCCSWTRKYNILVYRKSKKKWAIERRDNLAIGRHAWIWESRRWGSKLKKETVEEDEKLDQIWLCNLSGLWWRSARFALFEERFLKQYWILNVWISHIHAVGIQPTIREHTYIEENYGRTVFKVLLPRPHPNLIRRPRFFTLNQNLIHIQHHPPSSSTLLLILLLLVIPPLDPIVSISKAGNNLVESIRTAGGGGRGKYGIGIGASRNSLSILSFTLPSPTYGHYIIHVLKPIVSKECGRGMGED